MDKFNGNEMPLVLFNIFGLNLNKSKCVLICNSSEYYGVQFSKFI
jgi:hypothetical protein